MEGKALNIIAKKLEPVLCGGGYVKEKSVGGSRVVFKGSQMRYIVEFADNKIVLWKLERDSSGEFDENMRVVISEWLFDPSVNDERDAEDIANDFVGFFSDLRKDVAVGSIGGKVSDKPENDGLHFFLNRLVTAFPELKAEVKSEKAMYTEFRYVTFIKEKFVPLFLSLVSGEVGTAKLKKVANVLNNFYESGSMDVRSTITMVILNSLEGEDSKNKVKDLLSDDLREAFIAGYKYKYKKVRPERLKKSLMSRFFSANEAS